MRSLEAFHSMVGRVVEVDADPYDADEAPRTPSAEHVEEVRTRLKVWRAQDALLEALSHDEPTDAALVTAARRMVRAGALDRVRALGTVLESRDGLGPAGAALRAMVALEEDLPVLAWDLLGSTDRDAAFRLAPRELLRAGFLTDPEAARTALQDLLGRDDLTVPADDWFEIAGVAFARGCVDEARAALVRARDAAGDDERLVDRVAWLEGWFDSVGAADREVEAPAGTVSFAVLDYKQPDEAFASKNLGDHVQTIASLGHLARRSGFRFTGDPETVRVATMLQDRVRPDRVVEGDDAVIDLHLVQRDASHHHSLPDGTWALGFGWFMHPQFGAGYDMPMNPRLRPIFVSFHVNAPAFLTDEVVAYLRRYAPVGCRDWNTVHLLQAAGVPAFFSGCLTTTVDTVFPAAPDAQREGTLYVDTPKTGPGTFWNQTAPSIRRRSFGDNVDDAMEVLTSYQTRYAKVVTSRLHCCLPARSLGADVEFRAKNPGDVRFDGLIGIDDDAYDAVRQGMLALLEPVIGAIGAGRSEDEVYALWREVTAPAVAAAEALRAAPLEHPAPSFDLEAAVGAARDAALTVERTQEPPAGETVAVALPVGPDSAGRLDVVLEGLVPAASRPLHVHLTARGVSADVVHGLARRFPTVTFTWLPTDGLGSSAPEHAPTWDRLALPALLPEVARVVALDPRTLVLGDVAELADVALGGHPLAARTSPALGSSGFRRLIIASKRTEDATLAREIVVRTHTRLAYDVPALDAAVMVLDLDRLRADDVTASWLPWAERYGMDADEVLTAYAGADRVDLDPAWNRLPHQEVVRDARALSWTGTQGPWSEERVVCQQVWDDVASRAATR